MEFVLGAYTDMGSNKVRNQDSVCYRRASVPQGGEMLLAVVCDGMGGGQKGELASKACVEAFACWFDQNLFQLPYFAAADFSPIYQQWYALLQSVNQQLSKYSEKHQLQLGTTVVAFLAYQDRYCVLHVGDSRAYCCGAQLTQLTQDHSLIAREIARGALLPEQAYHHPQQNILLQCLGMGNQVQPGFLQGRVTGETVYCLCSDGFVHELSNKELAEGLSAYVLRDKQSITTHLERLVCNCRVRGEQDDITALVILTKESIEAAAPKKSIIKKLFGAKKNESGETVQLLESNAIIHTAESIFG